MGSSTNRLSIWHKYRILLICSAVAVLACLWWLFRPELLFVNRHVNEAAPGAIAALQPVFTGSLHAVGAAAATHGRVNILKEGGSLRLQVSSFESSAGTSFAVALAAEAGSTAGAARLGSVSVSGNKELTIPNGIDPSVRRTVLLMDQSDHVMATANLQPF